MHNESVHQDGDQRPGLLRVPGPIAAPGLLRPDSAGNDDQAEEEEAKGDDAVIAVNSNNKDWIERQMRRKFMSKLSLVLGTKVKAIQFVALD